MLAQRKGLLVTWDKPSHTPWPAQAEVTTPHPPHLRAVVGRGGQAQLAACRQRSAGAQHREQHAQAVHVCLGGAGQAQQLLRGCGWFDERWQLGWELGWAVGCWRLGSRAGSRGITCSPLKVPCSQKPVQQSQYTTPGYTSLLTHSPAYWVVLPTAWRERLPRRCATPRSVSLARSSTVSITLLRGGEETGGGSLSAETYGPKCSQAASPVQGNEQCKAQHASAAHLGFRSACCTPQLCRKASASATSRATCRPLQRFEERVSRWLVVGGWVGR